MENGDFHPGLEIKHERILKNMSYGVVPGIA
jgi:hypothetical protein